ncbi:hypothetical protein [Polaromonas sp.]|uniref:phosphorylase family protein n=1 Tax=Polaromonas sp. TaxID=1869339 RepID=UPI0035633D41
MKSYSPLIVLVVEDDPGKKQRMFDFLQERKDLFKDPEVCVSTADAIKRMQVQQYDLLILDVVIPARSGGTPNEQHSLDLLDQLDGEHGGVKRPRYVLAVSSVVNLSLAVKEYFRGRPWGIVAYENESAQALLDIESVSQWIARQAEQANEPRRCDVFVIAALEDPEFSATESAFGNFGPLQPLDSKQLVRFAEVDAGEQKISIAAAFCARMGPVEAALLTSKAIARLRPRLVVMVGICAGLSDKVSMGDVVAAEVSWNWQSGKFVDRQGVDGFLISPHQLDIDLETRNCLLQFKRDTHFWATFADSSRELSLSLPKLVLGPMATGASVLASERIADRIREDQHRSVIGLDMETYGVYAAAQSASISVRAVSLKAVCDTADKEKDDRHQKYAAFVSAASVRHFITHYSLSLI